ncbi:MAG: hypothetical protein B6247_19030 [Candidatus Parabeggiatoa sp. nov. 2]|nr:MAG: hypothetical protein B6247_19030 [Beggiatoa sp. 4572_84]
MLGKCDREEAVKALIEALNDDETVLRREAADSLGQIARRSPETKGLADAFENLITFINISEITPRATLIVRHKFFGYQVHSQKYNGYSFRNGYF